MGKLNAHLQFQIMNLQRGDVPLARFQLPPNGLLPPTLIGSIWHAGFSVRRRNPFACCRYPHFNGVYCDYDACAYLQQFGRDEEERIKTYYAWAQTIPTELWPALFDLPLQRYADYVADAVPPYAVYNLLTVGLEVLHLFKDAVVLDLYSGICGWLMAFNYAPAHIYPRKWVAVDIDLQRLTVCRRVGKIMGVEVETIKRDLAAKWRPPRVDIVVGSPPCHEFTSAKKSAPRRLDQGLLHVRRFMELAEEAAPVFAIMEEAASMADARAALEGEVARMGWIYAWVKMVKWGAIQTNRERLMGYRPFGEEAPRRPRLFARTILDYLLDRSPG
jgi:predicted RNA methylase